MHPPLNYPGAKQNYDLRKSFKSLLIWENKSDSEAVSSTLRKRKSDTHTKVDKRRVTHDRLEQGADDWTSPYLTLEDNKIKPLSNPDDPHDDFNFFWSPRELIDATKALISYDVKNLYRKNPYSVRITLQLVFLIVKYKPLLRDLLDVGEYFQRFPEDAKDENIVFIALFDILCRANGISLENEMDQSLRTEYKDIGLKVVYMQVERDKLHYFEQVYDRLNDIGASSVHDLLPTKIPIHTKFEFPLIFDAWINRSESDLWPEKLLEEAGFQRAGTQLSSGMTYREIVNLPYVYELEVKNYSYFVKTSHYSEHVIVPTDRDNCLAMAQVVKQLYKGGITKGTIIQTHILSLSSTAYFAYLLSISFPYIKLAVFGADQMKESFESYFDLLNLKNIKVFSKRFYIVNCRKKGIASTACVLVNPETVFNPNINIIYETMKRGCDIVYLQSAYDLYSENNTFDCSFINQYNHDLKDLAKCNVQRALSIPKVKFIVYQSFDARETADENIALNVVKYARECSHTSVVSVNENMSPTEIEDANYKYCKQLNLYFRQGNTPNSIVSPELWGSKPPFITTIYRVDPVIGDTETESEINDKHSCYGKGSSTTSRSVKSSSTRDRQLIRFSSAANSTASEKRRMKTSVGNSGFSTDLDMKKKIISSKVNVRFSEPKKKGQFNSENSDPPDRLNLQKDSNKILKASSLRSSVKRGQSSTISSVRRSSTTLFQVRESPDFKKMILSNVMLKNEPTSIPSEKEEDPVLKKILKNKRTKKFMSDKKEVSFSNQIDNADSQQVSESDNSSQIQKQQSRSSTFNKLEKNDKWLSKKGSKVLEHVPLRDNVERVDLEEPSESTKLIRNKGIQPRPSQSVKTNKINPRNEQNKTSKKIPSPIKEKSDKELKRGQSSSKYFSQITDKKETKKNKYPKKSKQIDNVKKEQTVLIAQQALVNVIKNIDSKAKHKNLPKKSFNTNRSNILLRNYSKVEKQAPIISFGTRIQPKFNSFQKNKKQLPSKKFNTVPEREANVKAYSLTDSQQKSINKPLDMINKTFTKEILSQRKSTQENLGLESNFGVKPSKFQTNYKERLNEMQKRFKKEIRHSFQTNFFHSKHQGDIEEKSNSGQNRPSSSVSWRTYVKTVHKLSELNLLELLKKDRTKKKKKRRKKPVKTKKLKRTKSSSWSIPTESVLMFDPDYKWSRTDTVFWSDNRSSDFNKHCTRIDKNELKTSYASSVLKMDKNEKNSTASSLMEMDKNEKISITSSFLGMGRKELKPSIISSESSFMLNSNKSQSIPKRRKTFKNKMKFKHKRKNTKAFKNESKTSTYDSDEEVAQQMKSKNSLTKVVLECNEGTQTKPLEKTIVYNVGTQADHLDIYKSLTLEKDRKEALQFYHEVVQSASFTSAHSIIHDKKKSGEIGRKSKIRKRIISSQTMNTEIEEDKYQGMRISKINSWFRKLDLQAPIPTRTESYILRRNKTGKRTITMNKSESSDSISEEDSDDMIEEGVEDIPPLIQDYNIENAQKIMAQMKMFDEGERDLKKLLSADITDFVDLKQIKLKDTHDEGSKEKTLLELEGKEEMVALNRNLLKKKAELMSDFSFTDDDGLEEEELFDMAVQGKDMSNLLAKLVDNIFESDPARAMRATVDAISEYTAAEPVKDSPSQNPVRMENSDELLQSPSFEEFWKNTTREAWLKINSEISEAKVQRMEKAVKEETQKNLKPADVASETSGFSDIVTELHKTPTDGLSPLARELYEIRDVVEYYLHSKAEPLDWRVMIDRRADD